MNRPAWMEPVERAARGRETGFYDVNGEPICIGDVLRSDTLSKTGRTIKHRHDVYFDAVRGIHVRFGKPLDEYLKTDVGKAAYIEFKGAK